ncbi:site-specific DNA-methyltransferase [Armatimonas sp.]|uniref:DNA-methyltransferase n=1 Tax=Armatimonas sp. TaxID=1872638 RepID=UPI00286C6E57|nr:site-specific DNA-methyltransferase [Armatimonas sp.]
MTTFTPLYTTHLGKLFCADSLEVMRSLPDESIDLVMTSPPYALHFKKEYGNASQAEYVEWFLPFAHEIRRILKPEGSFVLNVGGAWTQGSPTRSLYHFRLLIALCDTVGFHLAQEFFWYNPAKMPAPAEWVTVRRIRVKDSVEYIYWLSKEAFPKANNSNVLKPYSKDMERLIKRGLQKTQRPSGHSVKETFAEDRGGSIPGNLIECGNNESNSHYMKDTKAIGQKVHPARFPAELPRFFIKFLTTEGDVVLDPFAGSNTTGAVAESLERRWIGVEQSPDYAENSRLRFQERPKIGSEKGALTLDYD